VSLPLSTGQQDHVPQLLRTLSLQPSLLELRLPDQARYGHQRAKVIVPFVKRAHQDEDRSYGLMEFGEHDARLTANEQEFEQVLTIHDDVGDGQPGLDHRAGLLLPFEEQLVETVFLHVQSWRQRRRDPAEQFLRRDGLLDVEDGTGLDEPVKTVQRPTVAAQG